MYTCLRLYYESHEFMTCINFVYDQLNIFKSLYDFENRARITLFMLLAIKKHIISI